MTEGERGAQGRLGGRLGGRLWRAVLLPILVGVGLVYILVSLVEGPAIQDFLYAIF